MAAEDAVRALRPVLSDLGAFSRGALPRWRLRDYQLDAARPVAADVLAGGGGSFAWAFSRQSGKDETLAQLCAWLLLRYQFVGGSVVVAAPTRDPQATIQRDRLRARLDACVLTRGRFVVQDGYIVRLGMAEVRYLSAEPGANPRGQTASLLLVANEAQDIDPAVWDARFEPMGASTNATTLFMGTVWDNTGLLHRQMAHLEGVERDGRRRVWRVPWQRVAASVPAYGDRVRSRIAQFGADHPFIRTEYELVELDAEAGLFPPARLAQLQGDHGRRRAPEAGRVYAGLLDVAGEEEEEQGPGAWDDRARRDSTVLTVVEVETTGARSDGLPVYRVVDRRAWTGVRHTALHAQLVDLARNVWGLRVLVVDATGIGAGLASFLTDALGRGPRAAVVDPFVFTAKSKSDLGWGYVGLIDSGRVKEYQLDGEPDTLAMWTQLRRCRFEVVPGPGRLLRWAVPAALGHDDLLISAALVARLDVIDWRPRVARGADAGR